MEEIRLYLLALVCLLFVGCKEIKESIPDGGEAIDRIMAAQETAWNTGDLDAFMSGYWESDSLTFVGSKGLTKGYAPVLANYKKSYPNQAAMGKLAFDVLSKEPLGDKAYQVLGKWTLFRTEDTLSGHYTLLWKYLNKEWVIVTDHSS